MKGAVELMNNTAGAGLAAGSGPDKAWAGGKTALIANGTFGGGSIKLQIKIDIGGTATYFDVASASLTAAGYYITDLPPGTYRAVTTTATAMYARLVSVPNS